MATQPIVNPQTGIAFRPDENPFEGGSAGVDPIIARMKQESFARSFQNKPSPSADRPSTAQDIVSPPADRADQVLTGDVVDDLPTAPPPSRISQLFQEAGAATSALPQLQEREAQIRAAEAERRRIQEEAINRQFAEAKARALERGEAQVGGTEAQLGVTRGLGASSSRLQFIANQRKEIQQGIADLEARKADALANLDLQAAEREEKRINELREQDFKLRQQAFQNQLALLGAERQERQVGLQEERFGLEREEFQQERALSELDQIINVGGSVPEPLRQTIEQRFGEGFVDQLQETKQLAKQAQTREEQLEAVDNITKILSRVPEGQQIEIGDSVYSGFKTVDPNTRIFKEVNRATGEVTFVTVDEETGEIVNVKSGGRIGSPFKGRAGGGGGSGSGTGIGVNGEIPTFEEFVQLKQEEEQRSINIGDPRVLADLQAEYQEFIGQTQQQADIPDFTRNQKQRLAQAGLLGASQQEQLDFLFGNEEEEDQFSFENL